MHSAEPKRNSQRRGRLAWFEAPKKKITQLVWAFSVLLSEEKEVLERTLENWLC